MTITATRASTILCRPFSGGRHHPQDRKRISKEKTIKPGIAGLWQVSGRSETTFEERVAIESYYVHSWGPWLDVWILAKTGSVVILGQGAY